MKEQLDSNNLPKHIAVIMDGNGRWAKQQGFVDRIFGHRNALKAVNEVIEGCGELGISYLTLYAFSTENWNRPKAEVDALMMLLVKTIKDELPKMQKNNIRLETIGATHTLPEISQKELRTAIEETKNNTGLTVILALSYSGKWDIVNTTKKLAQRVQNGELAIEDINEQLFEESLDTKGIPNPDLMIRTGGDHRISNFLLWQLAYAELFIFEELFWPDFRKEHLHEAILDYQDRERRFGKTSEQIKNS
ncbi:undecaprenyl diphosphate synthase [Arcicella aurantiaca]|uniref:Isoprenyl transferase n=1 Tax=Arcicella aurantiaca TaxID=591202 RepID=A0A316EZA8_9BACT|nr:isoprenyl transferase [Arcicella aurantiaca]PWK28605.1 undecaprenyl diphosphate synthase [Arcicella aurantiaca]